MKDFYGDMEFVFWNLEWMYRDLAKRYQRMGWKEAKEIAREDSKRYKGIHKNFVETKEVEKSVVEKTLEDAEWLLGVFMGKRGKTVDAVISDLYEVIDMIKENLEVMEGEAC